MMHEIELVDPDGETYAELSSRFADYNAAHSNWDWRSFSYVIRDANRIVAGGRGIINMGALEVRGLWVDGPLRGQGIGEKVLFAIEGEARRRGASRPCFTPSLGRQRNFMSVWDIVPFLVLRFQMGENVSI